jgi:hypothetical protein
VKMPATTPPTPRTCDPKKTSRGRKKPRRRRGDFANSSQDTTPIATPTPEPAKNPTLPNNNTNGKQRRNRSRRSAGRAKTAAASLGAPERGAAVA